MNGSSNVIALSASILSVITLLSCSFLHIRWKGHHQRRATCKHNCGASRKICARSFMLHATASFFHSETVWECCCDLCSDDHMDWYLLTIICLRLLLLCHDLVICILCWFLVAIRLLLLTFSGVSVSMSMGRMGSFDCSTNRVKSDLLRIIVTAVSHSGVLSPLSSICLSVKWHHCFIVARIAARVVLAINFRAIGRNF